MMNAPDAHGLELEQSCSLLAAALSRGLRARVRLVTGEQRSFGLSTGRTLVHVPYPVIDPSWSMRSLTCGIALQCSPSKDRIARHPLHELSARELRAVSTVEGEVALGFVCARWPGLMPELARLLPELSPADPELDSPAILERALALARTSQPLAAYPLLGALPVPITQDGRLRTAFRKLYGRMPWSERKRIFSPGWDTIPVGGEGGVQNPNLPPPSRPEEEDPEIRPDQRVGVPYPEWSMWSERLIQDHVAVLEQKYAARGRSAAPASANLHRWFEEHTHRVMQRHLPDGSDLDLDGYIQYHVDNRLGQASEPRFFRDLLPASRDVTTALLLDGSASLGAQQRGIFQLELACADALCHAMALARERHGLFLFSGHSRHRVEVTCLRDFHDAYRVIPSELGLTTGGYTRLGAPLRHLTARLLAQPSERRLLIVIGDGLISDDGYEGAYAWADSAHAVLEAEAAGVTLYYIGVGTARVDPLPDVFGSRRSTRIRRVEDLPRVLARVHRELVSA